MFQPLVPAPRIEFRPHPRTVPPAAGGCQPPRRPGKKADKDKELRRYQRASRGLGGW